MGRTDTSMTPHLETISTEQRRAMAQLGPYIERRGMYLAGGTAVALQLGHRRSVDLDWFSPEPIDDPMQLANEIKEMGPFETDSVDRGTLHGRIFGVRVSFLAYRYSLLQTNTKWPQLKCPLASIRDLAAMKLVAVVQRGSRKDFVDVHSMGLEHLSLDEMLQAYCQKYSLQDVSRILYSLTYFDDADLEPMPSMLWDTTWDTMKDDLRKWVKRLAT